MKIIIFIFCLFLLLSCNSEPVTKEFKRLELNIVSDTDVVLDSIILYATWDTTINIYSLIKQDVSFKIKLNNICHAIPLLEKGKLYFPLSTEEFVCMDVNTHSIIWKAKINGRCSRFDLVSDSMIVASVNNYGIVALDIKTGNKRYELLYSFKETQLPDLSPWPVAFDDKQLYISNWQRSLISCFQKSDGKLLWKITNEELGMAGEPVVLGKQLFFGVNFLYKNGLVLLIDKETGKIDFKTPSLFEERMKVINRNDSIYFYTYDQKLNIFYPKQQMIKTVYTFSDEDDISGSQMKLLDDDFYYSDNSFIVTKFSLKDLQMKKLGKQSMQVTGVCRWKDQIFTY